MLKSVSMIVFYNMIEINHVVCYIGINMADISTDTENRGYLYYFIVGVLVHTRPSNLHICLDMTSRIFVHDWFVKV